MNDDGGTIKTLGQPILGQTSATIGYGNGLYAFVDGGGNIVVSMASGAIINSAASGIFASNAATDVSSTSSISVTANGTINSGSIVAPDGSRPAGILAGYNSDDEPESNVAGNVVVVSSANITATVGDGIRAYNFGQGDVTVTDNGGTITTGPNGQLGVDTDGQYGINAVSDGVGIVSVTMSADSTIDANGSGIFAENGATTIPSDADAGAGSSITVTAEGTINSGTNLTQAGNPPAGILAGYNSNGEAEPNVNGTVTVNNFGNITALGGDGIRAFNFGEGDVTVNENYGTDAVASSTVSGALDGIVAEALSGGTGNVTVNVGAVGANTTISSSTGSAGVFGIEAFTTDTGNVSVLMAGNDLVTSGCVGIAAVSWAASTDPLGSSITVAAVGTIDSGSNLQPESVGGLPPAGILAGYDPDNAYPNNTSPGDSSVAGNVSVSSDATINAPSGYGIWAFNFGIGDTAVTTGADSVITASGSPIEVNDELFVPIGIAAYASDGGDASIVNEGSVTAANGIALLAQATGSAQSSGTATITNDGIVSGSGTSADPVVQLITVNGAATLYNAGRIAPVSSSASGVAISESGGPITINNTGTITGEVALANATFNNESGGIWNVSGSNAFASGSVINDAGTINATGDTSIGGRPSP